MGETTAVGDRLGATRRENSLTQEELAHLSGVSQEMIAKIEQGRRQPRLTVLAKLATALDIPLSELIDNRPRLGSHRDGASILAIRNALLSPTQLPGTAPASNGCAPPALAELSEALTDAARLYWSGDFAHLAAMLPILIGQARLAAETAGPPASAILAQVYDLAAALLVHMGKEDLAALSAERAATAATNSNDEILHALLEGTYAWVLLHQGRLAEAEELAAATADRIEPSFSAEPARVAAWGHLLMTALAPAATAGHDVGEYVSLASAGAERIGHPVKTYAGQAPFGKASVAMQACHAYAVMREPEKALTAARKISPGDLAGISYGRHLLDVAQAHTDARHRNAATTVLRQARDLSPVWFRHQGVARSLVADLIEQQRRLSPALRDLSSAIDPNWYAPYHRRTE